MRNQNLFFAPVSEGKDFSSVLSEVQEYIAENYSTLITSTSEDSKVQMKRYITKYIQDKRIAVQGYEHPNASVRIEKLVDALYTEMAEYGFLTKYIFGEGGRLRSNEGSGGAFEDTDGRVSDGGECRQVVEEIDVNSWRDIEVQYSDGRTVKLTEHFDSPDHAINVIRRYAQFECFAFKLVSGNGCAKHS